jgi:hypothetical protein
VRWAAEHGFEAHAVDAQSPEAVTALGLEPADVVVAGEIVEHLDAPGPFFRAMRELVPNGLLVVTPRTPTGSSTSWPRSAASSSSTPTTPPGTARTRWPTCWPAAGGSSRAPPTTRTRRRA